MILPVPALLTLSALPRAAAPADTLYDQMVQPPEAATACGGCWTAWPAACLGSKTIWFAPTCLRPCLDQVLQDLKLTPVQAAQLTPPARGRGAGGWLALISPSLWKQTKPPAPAWEVRVAPFPLSFRPWNIICKGRLSRADRTMGLEVHTLRRCSFPGRPAGWSLPANARGGFNPALGRSHTPCGS